MIKKLITLAVVALAASLAAAQPRQMDIEREVGLLMGHEKIFEDYCIRSFDYVKSDIRKRVNEQTSAVYLAFFGAATEVGDEILSVEKQAVEELARQVANPEQEISEGPLSEDKVVALIEQGKREIQQQGLVGRLVAAGKTAGQVVYNAANSAIFVRLAKARSVLDQMSLIKAVESACELSKSYEKRMETDLEETKSVLAKEHSADSDKEAYISSVNVRSLKCFTPKTVTRVSAFCDLLKNGSGAFMKMLGLKGSISFKEAE